MILNVLKMKKKKLDSFRIERNNNLNENKL